MASETRKIYGFPGKYKSQVWECFGFYMDDNGKLDRTKAICRMCRRAIAYSGNTTNLHNHVSHHHPQVAMYGPSTNMAPLAKYYNISPDNSNNSGDSDTTVKTENGSSAAQCSYVVQSAILEFLISDLEPVQTLDSPTFRSLLRACGSKQDCPASEHFTNFLLDCYGETRQKVLLIVSNAKSAYLKLNIWKSTTGTNNLTVSVQILHSEMKVDSFVLQTFELPEDFTHSHISGCIGGNIFSEWNIPETTAILSPDVKELAGAAKDLNCLNIKCLIDSLNLAVNDCLMKPVIVDLLNHARKLIRQFTENSSNMNLLHEKQTLLNLPHAVLKLDTRSSWMSSYEMLDVLQGHAAAVYSVLKDPLFEADEDDVKLLNADEQTLTQNLLSILKSLVLASSVVAEMAFLSAAVILPILKKLETTLKVSDVDSRVIVDVKSSLWKTLAEKYSADDIRDFLLMCSAVDPRYKDLKFVEPQDRVRATDLMKQEMTKISGSKSATDDVSASTRVTSLSGSQEVTVKVEPVEEETDLNVRTVDRLLWESQSPTKRLKVMPKSAQSPGYTDWLDDVVHEESPADKSTDVVSLEFSRFDNEKQILSYNSPLSWWNERKFIYPLLHQVAIKYLSAPAVLKTSDGRQELLERKRQCIPPDFVEYMVFLNANYFKTRVSS